MSYKLYLEDREARTLANCASYMCQRIGNLASIYLEDGWIIARNFDEFVATVKLHGIPSFVSYDHDLADEHYQQHEAMNDDERYAKLYDTFAEKTGLDCAKWLKKYCEQSGVQHPKYVIHSMNPSGKRNIESELNNR